MVAVRAVADRTACLDVITSDAVVSGMHRHRRCVVGYNGGAIMYSEQAEEGKANGCQAFALR